MKSVFYFNKLLLLKTFKISMLSLHCSASLDMEIQIPWSSFKVLYPEMAMFLSLMLVVLLLLQQLFLFILTTCWPTHGLKQDA
jgi:hypothetical protein